MSRVAPLADPADRRRGIRRIAVVGAVLTLPQLIAAWLVLPSGWELVSLVLPFVYVAGVLVLSVAATRAWKLRSERLLPIAVAGVACIVVATVLFSVWPPDQAQYLDTGTVLVPFGRGLHLEYLFVLVGALWQFGLFVLVGSIGSALTRQRTGRAAR
ncbi:hypothetical protein [uncultured Amnibacterium sp.]|uniref:hypothetical protein n=1 Tax=uncultured Amnibacterium sp. TaxID=1631851 RepID=UPI0035CBCCE6